MIVLQAKCDDCEGKGHFHIKGIDMDVECEKCNGTGKMPFPEDSMLCPECHGKGQLYYRLGLWWNIEGACPFCNSRGYLMAVGM